MTTWLGRLPLRRRLVLGFLVAMLVLLLAAGGFVYWRVLFALDRGLDRDLDQAISALGPLVTEDGRITDETAVAAAGVSYQVLDADGTVLSASGAPPDQSLVPLATARKSDSGIVRRDVGGFLLENGQPLRVEVSPLGGSSPGPAGVPRGGGTARPARRGAPRAAAPAGPGRAGRAAGDRVRRRPAGARRAGARSSATAAGPPRWPAGSSTCASTCPRGATTR